METSGHVQTAQAEELPVKQDVEAGGINPSSPPPTYGASEQPPPSYDETPKDAPPSYQMLFGQIKDARAESSGPLDFLKRLVKLVLNTIAVTVFMIVMLAVPIAMIVIGSLYKDDCPAERMIPIYLIVSGSLYIIKNALDLCQRGRSHGEDDDQHENSVPNNCSRLIGCFLFGWFIAGNVWIYRTYAPSSNPLEGDMYCDPVLYYFAFWITTLVYIFCAFCCFCLCCAALATAAAAGAAE